MTKTTRLPTKPGARFGGGFYAGRLYIDGKPHALIVAPRAAGEIEPMPWNSSYSSIAGATSYCNGLANTRAMAGAGSGLAKKILALRLGGFRDWHLPSRLEALVAFHELAGVKAFAKDAFDRAWYWTSTQPAEYADHAWYQYFGDGYQNGWYKDGQLRARAVRTIKL